MAFHGEKYNQNIPLQAFRLALMGLTDKQMADFWGVDVQTVDYWKRTKPRFARMLHKGKDEADSHVAEAWYKKACGFTRIEDHAVSTKHGVEIIKIERYYPPDTQAFVKWMALRQREKFSEVQRIEQINTNINITKIDLTGFSTEKLKLLEEMGLKQLTQNAGSN